MADKEFDLQIKECKYARVILMSGGSASGKTEFIRSHLFDEKAIIFDSTLSSIEGAKIKIKKALKYNKKVAIISVIPDDIQRAYTAFLGRERRMRDRVFFKTHIGARKTLLWIVQNYDKIKSEIITSSYDKKSNRLRYKRSIFKIRRDKIDFVESLQMTKKHLKKLIYHDYKRDKT